MGGENPPFSKPYTTEKMKWNGRYYRPGYGINVYPKKEDSIEDLLKPLGEKQKKGNVWIPVILNVLKEGPTPPPQPSPTPTPSFTPTQTPTPTITPSVTPSPSFSFDSDYQAILTYASSQGYTLPSATVQYKQNQLVADLKAASLWNEMDIMYVPVGDGDSNFASINWINPGNFSFTITGPITYTSMSGFTGSITAARLDTQFDPSLRTRGNNSDASMGAWAAVVGTGTIMGSYTNTRQHLMVDIVTEAYSIYAGPTTNLAIQTGNPPGLWVTRNNGSGTIEFYQNDVLISSGPQGANPTLSNLTLTVLQRRRSATTYDYPSPSRVLFVFHGSRNATTGLYSIINNYISSL